MTCLDDAVDRYQLGKKSGNILQMDHVRPIGRSVVWILMDLHKYPGHASGNRGTRIDRGRGTRDGRGHVDGLAAGSSRISGDGVGVLHGADLGPAVDDEPEKDQ